jgi:hypothetical protein
MMYEPENKERWTATPREAPAWLKQLEYKAAKDREEQEEQDYDPKYEISCGTYEYEQKLARKRAEKRYPLDPYGWLLVGALILFAVCEFTCTLARSL